MSKPSLNKKFFKKKAKQKYPRNAFFSYQNKDRSSRNFDFKDFRNSISIHSKFIRSSFYGTYFNKCSLKYCSFGGATFQSIDFIHCNFRGSRFLGATFKNCLFQNCTFEDANFKNAQFINCFVKGSKFKGARNLSKDFTPQKLPTSVDVEFMNLLHEMYAHSPIKEILSKKNIIRLCLSYSKQEILNGLAYLNTRNIKYLSFSHLTLFTERASTLSKNP